MPTVQHFGLMDGDFWLTVQHIGLSQRGHADAFFCNGEIASDRAAHLFFDGFASPLTIRTQAEKHRHLPICAIALGEHGLRGIVRAPGHGVDVVHTIADDDVRALEEAAAAGREVQAE